MKYRENQSKIIWALIVGFLLGLFVGMVLFRKDASEPKLVSSDLEDFALDSDEVALSPAEDTRQQLAEVSFAESDLVNVKDQIAGKEVFISRVEFKKAGWVAIQEDSDGQAGNILGAARFDAGVYQGTVKLLRATEAGMRYHATLWYDDGDDVFDHTKDTLLATGGMMFEAF